MELIVARKYRIGCKIGEGGSGEVYVGNNVHTGEEVAIKLEPLRLRSRGAQLPHEGYIYRNHLNKTVVGFPSFHWYGAEGDYNVLVIEQLGASLEVLRLFCNGRFSLKTVLMLADQLIDRLEYFHSTGYLQRSVKPSNLLMGVRERKGIVYMIDFGNTAKYQDRHGQHVPYMENIRFHGTTLYASINAQLAIRPSRRDDMETLGYVLMHLLRGSLPWENITSKIKQQKHRLILENKQATVPDILCDGYPSEFKEYFLYCRGLDFEAKPDYAYLKQLFRTLFEREGYEYDNMFDWIVKRDTEQLNKPMSSSQQPSSSTIQEQKLSKSELLPSVPPSTDEPAVPSNDATTELLNQSDAPIRSDTEVDNDIVSKILHEVVQNVEQQPVVIPTPDTAFSATSQQIAEPERSLI